MSAYKAESGSKFSVNFEQSRVLRSGSYKGQAHRTPISHNVLRSVTHCFNCTVLRSVTPCFGQSHRTSISHTNRSHRFRVATVLRSVTPYFDQSHRASISHTCFEQAHRTPISHTVLRSVTPTGQTGFESQESQPSFDQSQLVYTSCKTTIVYDEVTLFLARKRVFRE